MFDYQIQLREGDWDEWQGEVDLGVRDAHAEAAGVGVDFLLLSWLVEQQLLDQQYR